MSVWGADKITAAMNQPDQEERLVVSPLLRESQIRGSSIDLRLGHEFILLQRSLVSHIDPTREAEWDTILHRSQQRVRVSLFKKFTLHPGQLVLGATLEYLSLPKNVSANVEGRSSWGRLGLIIATATAIAPGFKGCLTLELLNGGEAPLVVYPGVRIAQLVLSTVIGAPMYSGRYDCPTGPQFTGIQDDEIKFFGGPQPRR